MTAINILGKIVTINGQRFKVTSNFFEDGYVLEEIDDSKVKIIEESSDFDVINNRLDKLEKDVKDILKIVKRLGGIEDPPKPKPVNEPLKRVILRKNKEVNHG